MGASHTVLAVSLAVSLIQAGDTQFPAVCTGNITLPSATCCPVPPGSQWPCGGAGRGHCEQLVNDVDVMSPDDMRMQWPLRFFRRACVCEGHYDGYMCHECQHGFAGDKCHKKILNKRKNVLKLTHKEKVKLQDILCKAKNIQSDYVILENIYDTFSPLQEPLHFIETTVYNLFVFLHYFSSDLSSKHKATSHHRYSGAHLDFSHGGPAYLPWHRALLLQFERELQKLAGDPFFSLPYWDWMGAGTNCSICTDQFLGSTNFSNPARSLNRQSVFSKWQILDPSISELEKIERILWPTYEEDSITRGIPTPQVNPTTGSPPGGVHNLRAKDTVVTLPSVEEVHVFLNGTMTNMLLASNDPAFFLHHVFLDLLFEIWIRLHGTNANMLPEKHGRPGHSRFSPLVPLFPVTRNADFMTDSRNLGYDYTDLSTMASSIHVPVVPPPHEGPSGSMGLMLTVLVGCIILVPILCLATYYLVTTLRRPRSLHLRDDSSSRALLGGTTTSSYCSCSEGPVTKLPVQFYFQSTEEELDFHWTKQGYLPEPFPHIFKSKPRPMFL